MCYTTYQCHRDESHDHPSYTALGQVPLEGNLYEIGIEDDGVDDDGWGEDEIKDKPEYLEWLFYLIFVLADKGAAHLRSQHKEDELSDMLIEMLGFVDAEDIEEGGHDGQYRHIKDAGNKQPKEHLGGHMQGMGSKRSVGQPSVTYDEQNRCQDVGKSETESPKEGLQIECHQGQEKEKRGIISPAVDAMEPEGQCHQRHEKPKDVAIHCTYILCRLLIPYMSLAIPYGYDKEHHS